MAVHLYKSKNPSCVALRFLWHCGEGSLTGTTLSPPSMVQMTLWKIVFVVSPRPRTPGKLAGSRRPGRKGEKVGDTLMSEKYRQRTKQ